MPQDLPDLPSDVCFRLAYIAAGAVLAQPFSTASNNDTYTAGFFDGEGNIGINRTVSNGHVRHLSRCEVVSTDHELLDHLIDNYGGRVKPKNKAKANHTPALSWTVHSSHAMRFLQQIGPYLRCNRKRAAAQLVLALEISRFRNKSHARYTDNSELWEAREWAYKSIISNNTYRDFYTSQKNLTKNLADIMVHLINLSQDLDIDPLGKAIRKLTL